MGSNEPEITSDKIRCSFCGKSREQSQQIVAGPGVYICDECVALCNEIIEESLPAWPWRRKPGSEAQPQATPRKIMRAVPRAVEAPGDDLIAIAQHLDPNEFERLWVVFERSRSQEDFDHLIQLCSPLVEAVTREVSLDDEQLRSYAAVGLIDALETYDPGGDLAFEMHAIPRMKAFIVDQLERNADPTEGL
jgi:hypothetical protein